ncbi:hypothetical protein THAOC_06019, partial [Thalassiosira oceanica]
SRSAAASSPSLPPPVGAPRPLIGALESHATMSPSDRKAVESPRPRSSPAELPNMSGLMADGPRDQDASWPPELQADYERLRPLGQGAFGVVWLAKTRKNSCSRVARPAPSKKTPRTGRRRTRRSARQDRNTTSAATASMMGITSPLR